MALIIRKDGEIYSRGIWFDVSYRIESERVMDSLLEATKMKSANELSTIQSDGRYPFRTSAEEEKGFGKFDTHSQWYPSDNPPVNFIFGELPLM